MNEYHSLEQFFRIWKIAFNGCIFFDLPPLRRISIVPSNGSNTSVSSWYRSMQSKRERTKKSLPNTLAWSTSDSETVEVIPLNSVIEFNSWKKGVRWYGVFHTLVFEVDWRAWKIKSRCLGTMRNIPFVGERTFGGDGVEMGEFGRCEVGMQESTGVNDLECVLR
jgi:hypothetical protein